MKRGQIVALVENTDVVSLQREYYSASKECELALADLERQKLLNRTGAGVKKNAQQAAKEYHVAQPFYVAIDNDGNPLAAAFSFKEDVIHLIF